MNFKNLLKKISNELNFSNLDKVLNTINTSFAKFSNIMNQLDKGVNDFTRELKFDLAQDQNNLKREKINSKHLKKLWGDSNSSNDVKIWSDKKSKEKLF